MPIEDLARFSPDTKLLAYESTESGRQEVWLARFVAEASPLGRAPRTVGFLGYDLNQSLERLAPSPPPTSDFPLAWLAYYPWALVQDIVAQRAWLVGDSDQALTAGRRRLESINRSSLTEQEFKLAGPWHASSTEQAYLAAIKRIQQWIDAFGPVEP